MVTRNINNNLQQYKQELRVRHLVNLMRRLRPIKMWSSSYQDKNYHLKIKRADFIQESQYDRLWRIILSKGSLEWDGIKLYLEPLVRY